MLPIDMHLLFWGSGADVSCGGSDGAAGRRSRGWSGRGRPCRGAGKARELMAVHYDPGYLTKAYLTAWECRLIAPQHLGQHADAAEGYSALADAEAAAFVAPGRPPWPDLRAQHARPVWRARIHGICRHRHGEQVLRCAAQHFHQPALCSGEEPER